MPGAAFQLTERDLEDFATGAWILGTGGGGDPYFSLLEAKLHLAAGRQVTVIDPLSLPDDALVACVGQMGAPLAKQEKLCDGEVIASTIPMMEEHLGRRFGAVMQWGGGGANGKRSLEGTFLPGCTLTARAAARSIAGRR